MHEDKTKAEMIDQTDARLATDGLTSAEAHARLERDGPNEVAERKSHPLLRFARKFWGLSAWMIELIVILSFVLHKLADFWIALALLVVNAVLSFLQETRAAKAVAALRSQLHVMARVRRDANWLSIPARELVAGDVVRLRSGDFIPADVRVETGALSVDQSAITGESRALEKTRGESLLSGAVVQRGEATATVTATGPRSYFGRTTQLVESAHPKLHVEAIIARVVRWLFVIVGTLVAITLAMSLAKGLPLIDILPLSLVLLMSAVPVALPVMFTVTMALGSVELARHGVLVTRLSATEDAAGMQVLCADKTGTLTMNRLTVVGLAPQFGCTEADVLRDGALASSEANQDPIDLAFLRAARERGLRLDGYKVLSFEPFSAQTRRTEAVVQVGAHKWKLMKGAVRTIAQEVGLDASTLAAIETRVTEEARKGFRALAVARAEDGSRAQLIGIAFLYDAPRADSRALIVQLRELGISVKMLTGDALPVAQEVARELNVGEVRAARELSNDQSAIAADNELIDRVGGFAEVYPEDKFKVVTRLQTAGLIVGMTGDGVNDAPALRQAEVGIAVQNATDVAKGAASAVLTTEGLQGIVELVKSGRSVYQRVLTWIVNKVSRTILKAGFVVVAFLVTGKFVISALGMVLLVFMTDFVKIALSTDHVRPSPRPETWNIGPLVKAAVVLGVAMLIEALGLLAIGWRTFNLASHQGQLQTFAFQSLLFFALFSIISIRERRAFWTTAPSTTLVLALVADAIVGLLIGAHGLGELHALSFSATAVIVAYAGIFSLGANDWIKRFLIDGHRATPNRDETLT